jgi:glycosyltransferase involved in cell wall biosynthesis
MKALVWHWGRRGAGPLFAARLAAAMGELPGCSVRLSLAAGAEILTTPDAPVCHWREPTYESRLGFLAQRLAGPLVAARTLGHVQAERPDIAICAMPALLDGRMVGALGRAGIPYAAIVHDAAAHPGEGLNFRVMDQRRMLRRASCLFPLTRHVETGLLRQGFGRGGQVVAKLWHPPIGFAAAPAARMPGARPRILYFGRLLPYKGLDLLASALERMGPARGFDVRICGDGPASRSLERLRALPGVVVEQRWFADGELPGLLEWADGLVLPYREASQSGVAALAIAAGRHVLATNVGGLPEQLGGLARGMLCDPEPAAIAAGLARLVARLGEPAAERVDAAADWRRMAGAMREALSGVMREDSAELVFSKALDAAGTLPG